MTCPFGAVWIWAAQITRGSRDWKGVIMPVGKFDLINIGMARRRTLCSSSVHISGTPSLAETQLRSKCTEPPVVCEVSLKKNLT